MGLKGRLVVGLVANSVFLVYLNQISFRTKGLKKPFIS